MMRLTGNVQAPTVLRLPQVNAVFSARTRIHCSYSHPSHTFMTLNDSYTLVQRTCGICKGHSTVVKDLPSTCRSWWMVKKRIMLSCLLNAFITCSKLCAVVYSNACMPRCLSIMLQTPGSQPWNIFETFSSQISLCNLCRCRHTYPDYSNVPGRLSTLTCMGWLRLVGSRKL